MTSDSERREIANGLRRLADGRHNTGVPDSEILDVLEISHADMPNCSDAYDVEILADLIDRPTCHISETDHEFEDSVRCDRCQMTFNRPWEPFKFCPRCGAEVVK
nr:MAG TPA: hydrogenase/urease nickel incorporation protein [Caudoviricetes sp.]